MAIVTWLQSIGSGPTHLFTLDGVGTSTSDDLGGSVDPTNITGGNYSFVANPVCYGVSQSLRSTTTVGNTTDGAIFDNRNDINGVNGAGNDTSTFDYVTGSRTLAIWCAEEAIQNPSAIYKQGGTSQNFAFMGGSITTFQVANSGQTFLIVQSGSASVANRSYLHVGVWEHNSQHSGSGNRILYFKNGVLQGEAEEDATNSFPAHTGSAIVGNSGANLRSFAETTFVSQTRQKDCNFLAFYNNYSWTASDCREFFERSVIPEVVIASDTVANQQVALDALIGNSYANVNCAISIRQATDATDYRLILDNITFAQDPTLRDIAVQYVGPNTLTLENANGSNAVEVSTPDEVDTDGGTTVLTGGGTITIVDNILRASAPGTITDDGDKLVITAAGSYTLDGARITEIENNSGGSVTVTLDNGATEPSTLTETDGAITLVLEAFPLTVPNAEDGTRVLVNRIETIAFDASDINTSTDEITLTGNQFTASSFPTLVRLVFASDATLPTSSPQIVNGGLYFVKSVSSNLVTISVTESGATVDFTAQGTDGASAFCTATGFTELDNSVVSGGSGYSSDFVISNGTALLIKAADWASSGGTASAGNFFQATVSWSGTSGASILDSVGRNVAPDITHNQIASLTSIALSSQVINASGTAVTEIAPISDGSTLSGVTIALEGVGRVEINANDTDGILPVVDLYMYAAYYRSTEDGIRIMFGGSDASVIATDIYNFVTNNIQFDNTNSSVPLSLVGAILRDGQGRSLVANMTNPIAFNVATTGTGAIIGDAGLSSSESDILTRIDGLIEDSGGDRFTTKALETAPTNVTSIAADAITASAIAADAVTEIQAGLSVFDASSDQVIVATNNDKSDYVLSSAANTAIATATEAALINEGDGQQLIDAILQVINSNLDVPVLELQAIASQVRTELSTELGRIDVAVSTRSSHAAPDLSGLSTFDANSDTVTVGTNNDKSGYSLSTAGNTAISTSVWGNGTRSLTDKTDYTITSAQVTDIATTTEAALLNEGDGQQLIDAIVQLINSNLDLPALELQAIASQVRTELSTELARIDSPISNALTSTAFTNSLPTNFTDLGINSSGHIQRVTLADTATTLTNLPTIPTAWVTSIQSGLGTSTNQSTIIANIAALNDSDATAANQTSILTLVTDLHQFKGLDASFPLSVNTSSNVATVNGKTLTQTTTGDTATTTRS